MFDEIFAVDSLNIVVFISIVLAIIVLLIVMMKSKKVKVMKMDDTEKAPVYAQTVILNESKLEHIDSADVQPYLVILSGQEQGKQYHLSKPVNTFGRSDVDIELADTRVSRRHGAFVVQQSRIFLQDYQSTNGSYVDAVRVVEQEPVNLTARIQIGNTLMKIEYKKLAEVESEQALYEAANTDPLTNISNRRAFMTRGEEEFSFSKRNNANLTIMMCDVDHFKKINDQYGHPAGDYVLRELAKVLQSQMRHEDLVARYGGEEFIIFLRSADVDAAQFCAERIRAQVEQTRFAFQRKVIPVTLSIGVCNRNSTQLDSLIAAIKVADDALYEAKSNGRNRVELIR